MSEWLGTSSLDVKRSSICERTLLSTFNITTSQSTTSDELLPMLTLLKGWSTQTSAPMIGIVRIHLNMLQSHDLDSIRVRDVSKVITVTVGLADCLSVHDLAAVSVRQASETRAGFWTVQWSYG